MSGVEAFQLSRSPLYRITDWYSGAWNSATTSALALWCPVRLQFISRPVAKS